MSAYKNKILILTFFSIFCINSFSQENSIYLNYYLNPFIINPAVTGTEEYPVAELSYKKQWLGITNAPGTILISGNLGVGNYDFYDPKGFLNKGLLKIRARVGLGAAFFADNNGPLSYTGTILSYAYHVPINNMSRLSFGLSVIGALNSLNTSMLKPDQSNDNYLLTGNDNVFSANLNFGIYYYDDKCFAGLSCNKILPDVSNANNPRKEQPSYFLFGGYKFMKNNNTINFEPSITVKKLGEDKTTFDLHSKFYIKRLNWIALSYSTSNKINLQFGLHLYKMVYAGYNYEYTLSKISSYNLSTNEIYLGINLGLTRVESIRGTIN